VAVNRGRGALGLEKHPDSFIGRIEKGVDFPGCHFGPQGLSVAKATLGKVVRRAARLYAQGPGEPAGSARLGTYVERRAQRLGAGVVRRDDRPVGPQPGQRPPDEW
jgi:hypothetical protein